MGQHRVRGQFRQGTRGAVAQPGKYKVLWEIYLGTLIGGCSWWGKQGAREIGWRGIIRSE